MMPDRLPPHDVEAEEAIIGSLLVDAEAWGKVAPIVRPSDFFREKNAWVYEACEALTAAGEPLNQITVGHKLARMDRLNDIGGLTYLSRLVTELPTPVGCEHYAQIVKKDAIYRRAIEKCSRLVQIAYNGNGELPVLFDEFLAASEALRADAASILGTGKETGMESLSEILDCEDEPLDAIISDNGDGAVLTADGKGFIVGPPGLGKTNLSLRLSRGICEGSYALGYKVPSPRRVLYIALEGSGRTLHRRLRKVWADADAEAVSRFFLVPMTLNLADAESLAQLDAVLQETRADVVIIDPLRNAHPWDENKSDEAARLMTVLDALIAKHHIALILIHHSRKLPPFARQDNGLEAVRGSTALAGWVQFVLGMSRETGNAKDRFVLVWNKTRDAEELLEPLVVDFDRATLDFIIDENAAVGGKVSDDAILTAVFNAGGTMKGTDIFEGFMHGAGVSERTIRGAVRALVKGGKLLEFVAAEDKGTRAKSYRLAEDELQVEE